MISVNATVHVERSSGSDELVNFARPDRTCEKWSIHVTTNHFLTLKYVTFIMTIVSDMNEPPRDMTKNLRDCFVMPCYVS